VCRDPPSMAEPCAADNGGQITVFHKLFRLLSSYVDSRQPIELPTT